MIMDDHKKGLDISWRGLWKVFFFGLAVLCAALAHEVILALLLAIVISSSLDPATSWLERRGLPRTVGTIHVFLAFGFLLGIILYAIIPMAIVDLNTSLTALGKTGAGKWLFGIFDLPRSTSLSVFLSSLSEQLFSDQASPLTAIADLLGGVGLAMAVVVSSFYLTLSRDGVRRFLEAALPSHYEGAALRIYERSRRKISNWFQTQLALSLVVGVLTLAALSLLGVRHALLIGVCAAVFELVPFVGPILSGGIAVMSASTTSPALAVYTLIVFLGIHQFEAHILVPLLVRRSVGLHPVIVITSLLAGMQIAGLVGLVLAVPVAAVLEELFSDWSARRIPRPEQTI